MMQLLNQALCLESHDKTVPPNHPHRPAFFLLTPFKPGINETADSKSKAPNIQTAPARCML
jgi:hypothetical protein